ncbi:MAG TPA: hypothetical protein VJ652_22800 [Noviherbaspirillum sp.]|nr:hypothetical protein [Noviherbaspirillum sp.]
MNDTKAEIEQVLGRVDATLETAKHGLDDLLAGERHRRLTGLRNLIVFGRSVTFVLQNLRSVVGESEFNSWYEPHQQAMKADPVMRYFVDARNELEKQGKLSVTLRANLSFSSDDIRKLGRPPVGAKNFFIGDQLGGSGWEIELFDGTIEKYYVELPTSMGQVTQHFSNFPVEKAPELGDATIDDLAKIFIERLSNVVADARSYFSKRPTHNNNGTPKVIPPYLRRVK